MDTTTSTSSKSPTRALVAGLALTLFMAPVAQIVGEATAGAQTNGTTTVEQPVSTKTLRAMADRVHEILADADLDEKSPIEVGAWVVRTAVEIHDMAADAGNGRVGKAAAAALVKLVQGAIWAGAESGILTAEEAADRERLVSLVDTGLKVVEIATKLTSKVVPGLLAVDAALLVWDVSFGAGNELVDRFPWLGTTLGDLVADATESDLFQQLRDDVLGYVGDGPDEPDVGGVDRFDPTGSWTYTPVDPDAGRDGTGSGSSTGTDSTGDIGGWNPGPSGPYDPPGGYGTPDSSGAGDVPAGDPAPAGSGSGSGGTGGSGSGSGDTGGTPGSGSGSGGAPSNPCGCIVKPTGDNTREITYYDRDGNVIGRETVELDRDSDGNVTSSTTTSSSGDTSGSGGTSSSGGGSADESTDDDSDTSDGSSAETEGTDTSDTADAGHCADEYSCSTPAPTEQQQEAIIDGDPTDPCGIKANPGDGGCGDEDPPASSAPAPAPTPDCFEIYGCGTEIPLDLLDQLATNPLTDPCGPAANPGPDGTCGGDEPDAPASPATGSGSCAVCVPLAPDLLTTPY